jgi:hypothetical protein
VAKVLGLVAGAGTIPALMAREARRHGWRVVAFALDDPSSLTDCVDRLVPCRLDGLGQVLGVLAEEEIRRAVLAGRVWKDRLLKAPTMDSLAESVLRESRDWTDDALLERATAVLAGMGIEVLDQRRFLAPWLAPAGVMAGPPPEAQTLADVTAGLGLARELARRGVGQTVVLRRGAVAAVEAMEGTDEAIRRGLALAGPGGVVVKATGPRHDYRFDVPAIGPDTVGLCVAGRAAALAVEADRVLLLERERTETAAAGGGLSLIGARGDPEPA